ncbi:hypothetical protein [Sessilibacter corallicola]|uniref:hypothetical protein n=1 Tax=Sessilibacter corallicola TaxID=2904075 RepID=UPI001E340A2E|nr:hypothetical protein [Sessilibacter corallicola]MCE2026861.1 hypothetical protein [Sessilibacter corallicola]
MRKRTFWLVLFLVGSVLVISLTSYLSIKERGKNVQKFIAQSIPEISDNWSYNTFILYVDTDLQADSLIESKLSAYSKLGKLVKCPYSIDNQMELSFFKKDTAYISIECEFEYGAASIRADLIISDNDIKFSDIEIISDIFY